MASLSMRRRRLPSESTKMPNGDGPESAYSKANMGERGSPFLVADALALSTGGNHHMFS